MESLGNDDASNLPGEILKDESGKIVRLSDIWPSEMSESVAHDYVDLIIGPENAAYRTMLLAVIFEPQFEYVFSDAQKRFLNGDTKGIGFRGILTSTGGSIEVNLDGNKYQVKDIAEVVASGREIDGEYLRVSAQKEKSEKIDMLDHHRVVQFSSIWVPRILESPDPESKNLTPAILVYDLDKLTHKSGYDYEFKNPESKSDSLLAAYVIDIEPLKKTLR